MHQHGSRICSKVTNWSLVVRTRRRSFELIKYLVEVGRILLKWTWRLRVLRNFNRILLILTRFLNSFSYFTIRLIQSILFPRTKSIIYFFISERKDAFGTSEKNNECGNHTKFSRHSCTRNFGLYRPDQISTIYWFLYSTYKRGYAFAERNQEQHVSAHEVLTRLLRRPDICDQFILSTGKDALERDEEHGRCLETSKPSFRKILAHGMRCGTPMFRILGAPRGRFASASCFRALDVPDLHALCGHQERRLLTQPGPVFPNKRLLVLDHGRRVFLE